MKPFSPCPAIRQWDKQRKGCRELLIAYGGMCEAEIEFLVEHMTPGSRVFWLEETLSSSSVQLSDAAECGILGMADIDSGAESIFFDLYHPKCGLSITLLNAERASETAQESCTAKLRTIQETMRLQAFNTGTLVHNGPSWQRNTLANLPRILTSPGSNALHNIFENRPALVVGAGPSLNDSIEIIKERQDRFVIISTGTALTPLRKAGIKPDLVMAIDASPLVERQFTEPCDDLYFVGSTIVCNQVPGRFKGEFYTLLESNPIDQWIGSISDNEGKLMAGGTVTACGMHLAKQLGCNPVVTVGLDLAYGNDGCSHASGTMYHGRKVEQNHLTPVPGNWDNVVYTTRQFSCYIDLIRGYVQDFPETRYVNITNGGARIEGMEIYKTGHLAVLGCEPFDAYGLIEKHHTRFKPSSTEAAQAELAGVIDYLDLVQMQCRKGAMASNQLMLMKRFPDRADPREMRECLDVIDAVDHALEDGRTTYDFLQMSLWPAAYSLAVRSQQSEEEAAPGDSALGRSRKFYEQVAGAAKWTKELILQCCEQLEQRAA